MVGITASSACSNTGSGPCLVLVAISSSAPYTIDSAADFLPSYMIEFMNFVITMFPNFGSGFTSRFSAEWRRDIDDPRLLRTLRAVFRTTLLTVLDALCIENAAENVIANAGQILHAAAADHDHRVLLKVVAF